MLLVGLGATLGSSTVRQQTVERFTDIDHCVTGCPVAAAGWPMPYLVDNPGLSPADEASLTSAATGVDRFRPEAFALDLVAWTLLAALVVTVLGPLRRGARRGSTRWRRDTTDVIEAAQSAVSHPLAASLPR